MAHNPQTENGTSLLVSVPAILVWTVACVLSLYWNAAPAAGLFFGLLLMSLLLRMWACFAIRNVSLRIQCDNPWIFPGQHTVMRYALENRKAIPLFWMELNQNGPADACLTAPDLESYHEAGTAQEQEPYLRQIFPFVAGWQTLEQTVTWTAQHRGLYPITYMSARTGDGFGLVQHACLPAQQGLPTLAVFPATVPVDPTPFLSLQWDTQTAQKGWLEDRTILQGNREYQLGDNWKQINWRMAAREQGLPVNLYQTIQPQMLHFVLDGESFCRVPAMMEDMLSILSSLLIELQARHMQLTLTLSQSAVFPAVTLTVSEEHGIRELLYHLAGFRCLTIPQNDSSVIPPSVFPESGLSGPEPVYIITRSGDELPLHLLQLHNPDSISFLCMEQEQIPQQAGYRSICLYTLRKGGKSVEH